MKNVSQNDTKSTKATKRERTAKTREAVEAAIAAHRKAVGMFIEFPDLPREMRDIERAIGLVASVRYEPASNCVDRKALDKALLILRGVREGIHLEMVALADAGVAGVDDAAKDGAS